MLSLRQKEELQLTGRLVIPTYAKTEKMGVTIEDGFDTVISICDRTRRERK